MKVLLLPSYFPTEMAPGRAPYVVEYARSTAVEHDVFVVYPQQIGAPSAPAASFWEEYQLAERIRVVTYGYKHISKTWLLPHVAAYRRVIPRIREDWAIDVIFVHTALPAGLGAIALGRLLRIPVILLEHWGPAIDWLDWTPSPRWLQRAVLKRAYRGADYLATVSTALGRDIAEVFGASHHGVLPNPIDTSVFRPPAGEENGRARYVCVTRDLDDPRKDVPNLLDAWSIVVARDERLRLEVIGPRTAGIAEEVRRRGLDRSCSVEGWLTPAAVARRMRGARAVVIPSRYETFGRTGVEALACGTPVVATRCGGPEEYVTPDVGILVEPSDPSGLAEALLRARDRGRFAPPGVLACRVQADYGYEAVCERFTAVAESLVSARR